MLYKYIFVLIQTDDTLVIMIIQHQLLLTLNRNRQYVTTCCDDPLPLIHRSNILEWWSIFNLDYSRALHGEHPFYLKTLARCCYSTSNITFSSIVNVNADVMTSGNKYIFVYVFIWSSSHYSYYLMSLFYINYIDFLFSGVEKADFIYWKFKAKKKSLNVKSQIIACIY